MTDYKRKPGHKVKPKSTASIHKIANEFRDVANIMLETVDTKLDIIQLYDVLQAGELLEYAVEPDENFKDEWALSYPDKKEIRIPESVFDGASEGNGFHRFTMAHELGHLLMHRNQRPTAFARGEQPKHKPYEDSEWQADTFASEFLIDSRTLRGNETVDELKQSRGVSHAAANYKLYKQKKAA
jgi:hypothetical protein